MRTVLAILIVFMHSFTCYNGSWEQPAGYVDIPLYRWLSRISFAFTLEAFVFISGYLFAFQRISLKRTEGCISLVINKLKRLLLPSIIFSIVYFALFYESSGLGDAVYSIINGCGHMWFLPMLFWCFLGGWLLEQVKVKNRWKFLFLVIINLFCIVSCPLRISNAAAYMVYFYSGFLMYSHFDKIDKLKTVITHQRLVWSWIVFIVFFTILRSMRDVLVANDSQPQIHKLFFIVGDNTCKLIYASVGLMAFYLSAVYYIQHHKLRPFTINFSSCCFGIYLFQQFVLQLFYYKTSLPLIVGPYWLPWCGFVIATIISYVLSVLLLKTKMGRLLIG